MFAIHSRALSLALAGAFVLSSSLLATESWEVDASHSTARFKIKHMMLSNVSGEITGMKGTFTADGKDVTKLVTEVSLDMNTINTNNGKRDEHLKSADFFDTAKHPTITFKSKKVTKGKGKTFKITGDLTMHGVTKEVTLDDATLTDALKDPWGNMRRAFTAKTKINRKDYGLTWNKALETGGVVVGETADIELEVELTQPVKTEEKKG